jgi:hypothetical protein
VVAFPDDEIGDLHAFVDEGDAFNVLPGMG